MFQKIPLFLLCSLCLALLSACKNYSVNLNNKTLYTPASIFTNYSIPDAVLANCVSQTIIDNNITRAEDLTQLNCSDAGITSIKGLAKFFALTNLNLSNNNIQELAEISKLTRLEVLLLQNNKVMQSAPILNLLHLRSIDLSNNPIVDCDTFQQIKHNLRETKTLLIADQVCGI